MTNILKLSLLCLMVFSFTVNIYAEDTEIVDPEPVLPPAEIPLDPIPDPVPEPDPAPTVTFIIRNGDTLIYQDTTPLPDIENDRNVLSVLQSIDESSDAFSITNIQEFSFGKYLKCILPTDATELCDNWQYAVGNLTPFSSIDTTMLVGGETVGIYFGTSHQLVLSNERITEGGSLTATAQKYNYETNAWDILEGVSVGVTLPNPDDAWNPIVVSTHPVDDVGIATITIAEENTFTLGIVEDFYFPSYTVVVEKSEEDGENGSENEGTNGSNPTPHSFSTADALSYLKSMQSEDGSFGDSDLYTDWAGIAFGSMNVGGSSKTKILSYFESNNEISSLLTDNERRAMTLLALDKNPYSFGDDEVNYIKAIVDEFDGEQFGDADLVNDDIFALIPLQNAGYNENDDMIIEDITFIISKQKSNGSWEESVDVTAAAIQALEAFDGVDGVSNALSQASAYLENEQNSDGGWGNVSSTSWAMQAESALNTSWSKNGKDGLDYLATGQEEDGAVSPTEETLENRIWATSYAVAGASGKSWGEIMNSVSKPSNQEENSGNNNENDSDDENDSRDDTEDEIEDVAPEETQIKTVVCPVGDFFNATTGEWCTEFVVINNPPIIKQETKIVKKIEIVETLAEEKTLGEQTLTTTETLTATAIGTLPTEQSVPPEKTSSTTPIVLGTLGGIVLLYIAAKFLIK
ncbi:hypothetical protein A2738_00930 [Candidatus Nomurabacteria bacterium RIFCSPHIGHO2_01_FULL_42_15]|uniref:Squalene cyclase C-terminal domain-containing protein n=1 Tax=Candidatus Nomurabacteria bacterium RIFCSPHIGHO2_01_FULL_42_15 TaxID=1801742 RepID=A0A1F6VFK1_9BACT|nr:MAG: hypothetical protein A2738_00930 [Candidatus Nomurabacteria bacterium RIFCSPHIGHO2_01_FULL_42_15]OGI93144.1 MAG: hypothetical protein A3A99_01240 [Candidatus Nomurabacteria bacterium RIFCSPLOWO2_01_FULL_41_18]